MVAHALAKLMLAAWGRVLTFLPRRFSLAAGTLVGFVLGRLGWKRTLVRSNLQLAFPGAGEEVRTYRHQLETGFYLHFGRLVVELLCQFGDWRRWVEENVEVSGLDHWRQAHARGRGVVFVTSHLGNWEAMAAGFALAAAGREPAPDREILIVTKHLKPEWLHRSFEVNRRKAGVLGTYEPKTMRDVLRTLGRGGTVGFVLDQYAGPPVGVRVPFFGVPVGTLLAPAAIVRRTGAAVLPASCHRRPDGRLVVRLGEEMPWTPDSNAHEELAAHTAAWVAAIEETIRRHPEQWLWSHRRFKGDLAPLRPEEWSGSRQRT